MCPVNADPGCAAWGTGHCPHACTLTTTCMGLDRVPTGSRMTSHLLTLIVALLSPGVCLCRVCVFLFAVYACSVSCAMCVSTHFLRTLDASPSRFCSELLGACLHAGLQWMSHKTERARSTFIISFLVSGVFEFSPSPYFSSFFYRKSEESCEC